MLGSFPFAGGPPTLIPDAPGTTSTASTPGTDRSTLIFSDSRTASFPARSRQVTLILNSCASPVGTVQVYWPVLSIQSGDRAFHAPAAPAPRSLSGWYSSLIGRGAMFGS